jgi:hypothetical protein
MTVSVMMKSLGKAHNLGSFAAAFLIMIETAGVKRRQPQAIMPRFITDPRPYSRTIQI